MPHRVTVQGAGIDATHHVGAQLQRLLKDLHTARFAQQARLREGDHRDICPVLMLLPRGQDAFQAFQPGIHVHLREAADPGGAALNHGAQGVGGPFGNAGVIVAPVLPVVQHHGPHARAAGVGPERLAQPGGIKVDMHIGEGRQQDAPVAFQDGDARRHLRRRRSPQCWRARRR